MRITSMEVRKETQRLSCVHWLICRGGHYSLWCMEVIQSAETGGLCERDAIQNVSRHSSLCLFLSAPITSPHPRRDLMSVENSELEHREKSS